MKNLNQIKHLTEILETTENWKNPVLIQLNTRTEQANSLLDCMIEKLLKAKGNELKYAQLNPEISKRFIEELHLIKNPVLLLIQQGEIKSIFSGMIAQFQLEAALAKLKVPSTPTSKAS